jgi:Ser-tRNA(Ala) deacylase AlaX
MAVSELGLDWIPGKGFHFPEGPYVEYQASLGAMDKEKLKADLEDRLTSLISRNDPVSVVFPKKDELVLHCRIVPDNIPEEKPVRVVKFGEFGVPCGGTHVQSLGDLVHVGIRKIKQEGPVVRIGYSV